MPKVIGSLVQHPARISFLWYAAAILLGGGTLSLPFCRADGAQPISLLDGVFTATSATCVTGLSVRSTGQDFSFLGQLVVLLLIQIGGIGIMTVTTFITCQVGGRQRLRARAVISETLGMGESTDLRDVLWNVVRYTLVIEGAGVLVLATRFQFEYSTRDAFWQAIFHSVSAFNNAGFGLRDDSLTAYQGDLLINGTIMLLIVLGGLGYPVMLDLTRNWGGSLAESWEHLMLHSKIMLLGTATLLSLGTVFVLALEWNGVLAGLPLLHKVQAAMFHSTTCRTAGFNTIPVGQLTNATLFLSILLMMIGAGPCSTGGGFKVSTLSVLVLRAWSTFRGCRKVIVARRTIPQSAVDRAMASALLFVVVGAMALTVLLVTEQGSAALRASSRPFIEVAFEVFSALGTVGLSTGLTPSLTALGKIVIILLMFIGRLGPFSVFTVLSRPERDAALEYAQEEPLIG